jgi:molecular chaperone DnaK (HSP70)
MGIIFEINANGILRVSTVDRATGNTSSIMFGKDSAWLSREEVKWMMSKSRQFKSENGRCRAKVLPKNSAKNKLLKAKRLVAVKSSPLLKQALQKLLMQFEKQFNNPKTNRRMKKSAYPQFGQGLLTFIKECS